ncbi:PH domain-containing protein [Limnovirga soli]|nr:PH domain-containing protein [Limnovirga soli]
MKQFNSKVGLELLLPISVFFGFLLYEAIVDFSWSALIITTAVIAFFGYLILSTKYIISKDVLEIKCGFLVNQFINIHQIQSVKEVKDIFSAPATSIYRLEIKYNQTDSITISPKNKLAFIQELLKINPAIEILTQ